MANAILAILVFLAVTGMLCIVAWSIEKKLDRNRDLLTSIAQQLAELKGALHRQH
jgi:hypothetical protein